MGTKVDQQTYSQPGCLEIIDQLSLMLGGEIVDGLQFDYDLFITDKIRLVRLFQSSTFVGQTQIGFFAKQNASSAEFVGELWFG